MYGKQWQTSKFLAHAGADIDYRPIAHTDNHPRNKAIQRILMGSLTADDIEALNVICQGSMEDFVDEQCYTILHRIVLDLSLRDLNEAILEDISLIDITNAMGRTPLAWAAFQMNVPMIITLLKYGARVNTLDVQYHSPVTHCCDRGNVVCARLLLEAGADPELSATHGSRLGRQSAWQADTPQTPAWSNCYWTSEPMSTLLALMV